MPIAIFPHTLLQSASPGGFDTMTLLLIGSMVVVMYLFMIRPQRKKQKEHTKMIQGLEKGDKVVTAGGFHGTVHSLKDDTVILKVDENVKLEINRSSITLVKAESRNSPSTDK